MFGVHILVGLLICLSASHGFKSPNPRLSAPVVKRTMTLSILRETVNSDNFLDYFQFKPSGELQKALGIGPHPPLSPPPKEVMANGKRVPFFLENDREILSNYVQEVADLIEAAKSEAHRDWSALTVSQLKQELKDRGLSTSGVKLALVQRLVTSDKDRLTALANAESAIADAESAMSIAHSNNDEKSALRATGELREKIIKEFLNPLVGSELEKGVSSEAIKGAALFGATLGAILSKNIPLAVSVGVGAAYVSISPGSLGQFIRSLGAATWDTVTGSLQFLQGIDRSGDLRRKLSKSTASSFARLVEVAKESQRIAKESQASYQAEYERLEKYSANSQTEVNSSADEARLAALESVDAKVDSLVHHEVAETKSTSEEEEARRLAKLATGEAEAEKRRLAEQEEAKAREAAEESRLAAIAAAEAEAKERLLALEKAAEDARVAEEERRVEEAEKAEKVRLAEEARVVEAQRRADAERKAEVARLEEEARLAQESFAKEAELSEADWTSSVRAAQQQIDGALAGWDDDELFDDTDKAKWESAEQAASLLNGRGFLLDEEDEEFDYENLALAARAAVEEFERQREAAVDDTTARKQLWSDNVVVEPQTDLSKLTVAKLREELSRRGLPTNGKKADLISRLQIVDDPLQYDSPENDDGELFGSTPNAAQDAVAMFESSQLLIKQDWNERTVAQLRSELKARGLATTGKKAELVAILEASDAEQQMADLASDDSGLIGFDSEDFGQTVRQSVDVFDSGDDFDDEPSDEALWEIENGAQKLEISYSSMSVVELKDELRSRGLSNSGRKADLVRRLLEADD